MTTKQKQVVGIGALLSFAIFALGYLLLVKPTTSNISTIKGETASQISANAQLQTQIAQLQAQQQGLLSKQVELKGIGQRIPSVSDIPGLYRDLTKVATNAGIDEATLTTGQPTTVTAGATTTTTAATTTAATTAATSTATPTATATPASTTPSTSSSTTTTSATTAAAALAKAASAPAAYQSIPVTLTVQGNYSQMVMLMDQLENLKRLFVVKSIALTPLKEGAASPTVTYRPDGTPQTIGDLSATVIGQVFETSPDTTSIDLPALDGATAAPTK